VDRRDDGEAERRRELELTGVVVRLFLHESEIEQAREHQWVMVVL
jgi:hypothetical protein